MAEKKKYIDVELPIINSSMRILGTPENLHNKTIKLDLTRQLRGKGLTIKFRIFNKEGKLIGIPNNLELVSQYIRRMMRKRSDYVEDSFQGRCADIRVTIKPHLITRKRVSRAVRKNLRNTAREFITEYIKEKDFNEVCQEILNGSLQKAMLPKLKKVYPLSFCDIRVFETKELEKIDLNKAIEKKLEEDYIPTEESSKEDTNEEESEEIKETEEESEEIKETEEESEEIKETEEESEE